VRKLLSSFIGLLILAHGTLGQGRVGFNNLDPPYPAVTITTTPSAFNPFDGPAGAFVGSNYTVSLVFVNGTVTSQSVFDSIPPIWVADTLFHGTTGVGPGHGFTGDGSGYFYAPTVPLVGQTDVDVTVQLWAWYNGNGSITSYDQSRASGHNVGQSNLLPLHIPPLGPPVNLNGLQPFTVGIPEPSSVSLILIGVLSLIIFRQLKTK